MRRTQLGRSVEHCQRESAAEKANQSVGKRKSSFEWKEWISGGCSSFFRCMPSEVRKEQRLRYTILYSKNQKNQTPRSEKSKGRKAVQNNFHEAFLQSFQSQNKNPESYGSIDWQGFLFGEISKVFLSDSDLENKVARKLNWYFIFLLCP